MAEIPYVCLYTSYLQSLSPYSDSERGRIVTAMLNYASTGEIPCFDGNERYIWPSLQAQIDRDRTSYQEKCKKNRTNGAKGGRPRKNPAVISETERFLEKPKKAKEKENDNSTFSYKCSSAPGLEAGEQNEELAEKQAKGWRDKEGIL